MHTDLLIEIGTEELPTKAVQLLGDAFLSHLLTLFNKAQISYQNNKTRVFATPRRFGLYLENVAQQIPGKTITHRGPPVNNAFNADGTPTTAAQGFAARFNISVDKLEKLSTDKGEYLIFQEIQAPSETKDLLLTLIQESLHALPIKKPMAWGSNDFKFVRPVHWAVVLFDNKVIPGQLFGQTIGNVTWGHRFHAKTPLVIEKSADYETLLAAGSVIANFEQRKEKIRQQIIALATQHHAHALMDEDLLTEVTCLVEWPVAVLGTFDKKFLSLPKEVISCTLKQNQKSFILFDDNEALQPFFITIANIDSKDVNQVISGNEKVVRARLSDAAFFFAKDQAHPLEYYLTALNLVVYQQGLGSLVDKSKRIAAIAQRLANTLTLNEKNLARAGLLCKADLVSTMVGEFPELQGIMGAYYAAHDGEAEEVISAIREHYQPQGSSDDIPATLSGAVLSISDKADTLSGIFALGKKPTGDKDPFALRRAAIGILRIMIEKQLFLDIRDLFSFALKEQGIATTPEETLNDLRAFLWDRLAAWLKEKSFKSELFTAVMAIESTQPYDVYLRVQALQHFITLPAASSLAMAHKRVNNILAKQDFSRLPAHIDAALLIEPAEKTLATLLTKHSGEVSALCAAHDYQEALICLSYLKTTLDDFFDKVLVNCEDPALKQNRLVLLKQLNDLFLHVADLSYLPVIP